EAADGGVVAGQPGQQVGVGFVGLVQVRYRDLAQHQVDHRFEAVGAGHCVDDVGQGYVVPAALALAGQVGLEISAAGPNADGVRGAAVLYLVDDIGALVHQTGVLPAQPELYGRPARRDGELAVVILQTEGQLVGLEPSVVGKGQTDQALFHLGGDVLAIDDQSVYGARVLGGTTVLVGGGLCAGLQRTRSGTSQSGQTLDHRSSPPMVSKMLPSSSMRLSSTRCRVRLNSMRRGAPSLKNRVLVSFRLSMIHRP